VEVAGGACLLCKFNGGGMSDTALIGESAEGHVWECSSLKAAKHFEREAFLSCFLELLVTNY